MRAVHAYGPLLGTAVALYAAVFLVALWGDLRGRREPPAWLWGIYGAGSVLILVQAATGILLYVAGVRPLTALHLVYGLLSAAGAVAGFGIRPGGFLRRTGRGRTSRVVALLSLTVIALLVRAYTTGAFGR